MELFNVHEAVTVATQQAREDQSPMVPASTKLPEAMKDQADRICEAHGITLSSFLRCCVYGLVRDYVDPKVSEI